MEEFKKEQWNFDQGFETEREKGKDVGRAGSVSSSINESCNLSEEKDV